MMTNSMSSIPAAAGATLMSTIGRTCAWLMKKYAAAPVTTTAVIALTLGLGMAANNALYGQVDHHPAPLFFGSPSEPVQPAQAVEVTPPAIIAPPPVRSAPLSVVEPAPVAEPTPTNQAETAPQSAAAEVSNSELANAQRKLQSMGLFNGDVDGFYGPKTAEAIRAFEMRNGMTPKGDMGRPVIDAILRADATDHASIDAARTTARNADGSAAPAAPVENTAPEAADLVAGQRALQALLSPQAEAVAAPVEPVETFATPTETQATAQVQPQATVPQSAPDQNPLTDANLIERIQTGLASLGFFHSRIDGIAGEETARAIRNFEVFNNYEVTGSVTPGLVDLLITAGAET